MRADVEVSGRKTHSDEIPPDSVANLTISTDLSTEGITLMIKLKKNLTLVLVSVLFVAVLSVVGVVAIKRQQDSDRTPKVISKVKALEVLSVTVKGEGEPDAVLAVVIRNNSDQTVVAVTLESGDHKDSSGIAVNGFHGSDEPPFPIIVPHGIKTIELLVSNLLPRKPIKVSGAIYADGTEEGEETTLVSMRKLREHRKKSPKGDEHSVKGGSSKQ